MSHVAIVGGGISGLSAAYFLDKAGHRCTLIESQDRLGGVIRTERAEGCLIEAGPDSFIVHKPWALELIRELGIEDQVIGSRDHLRTTCILRGGRLIPLPDGIQFLAPTKFLPMITTRLLSWRAKATMGLEWFHRPPAEAADHSGDRTVDRSVAEFVRQHYGDEVNEYLAQPMLAGVYGGSPEQLSISAVLPRFVELERKYGSLTRGILKSRPKPRPGASRKPGSLFLTLKGGMGVLTGTLAEKLEGRLERVTAEVIGVERAGGGFALATGGGTLEADQVVLAVPANRAAPLLERFDPQLAGLLGQVRYHSSITISLVYRRPEFEHPLNGFGFLIPRAEKRQLAACTWVNTKFAHRAADDRPLLRAFLAGEKAEALLSLSDAELGEMAHDELSEIMGFTANPAACRVHRWPRAMPQYEVGHQALVEEIERKVDAIPGLYLTGNAFTGIGIPDCIRRSRQVAGQLVQALAAGEAGP